MTEEGQKDTPYKGPVLNSVYPDAAALFAFGPASVGDILKQGMIIIDTNVLLLPYLTGSASLAEIKKTYKKLIAAKRLFVPGQVAREFAKSRPEQLTTLYQQIAQRRQVQRNTAEYPLLAELTEYKNLLEADTKVDEALRLHVTATRALLATVKSWLWNDPISSLYRELFTSGTVVDLPVNDTFEEDLQRRISHKLPPGYKDAPKDDGGVGDLLIWNTILHLGRTKKHHAVFVTGEEKSDWWHRSSGVSLYPRYELLEEYRSASDGQTFHIMSFAELLEHFGAKEAVVEEVRREQIAIEDEPAADLVMSRRSRSLFA